MSDPKTPGETEDFLDVEDASEAGTGDDESLVDPNEDQDDAVDEQSDDEAGDGSAKDDAGADDRQAGQATEVKGPSRRERRVLQALEKAERAETEARALRERLAVIEAQAQQRQTQADEAREQEQLALMPPEQQMQYLLKKQEQKFGNEILRLRFETADANDKAAFETVCARNSAAAAVRKQVEEVLANERRGGSNPKREVVLRYILGDLALERAARAAGKQTRNGQAKRQAETVRAPSTSSTVSRETRAPNDSAAARAKRLRDVQI